jgi:hypothetical protein
VDIVLATLIAWSAPTVAAAQYPDARLVPKGVLRVGFEPSYLSYRERYDFNGLREPLGTDFSDSAAGLRLFPTLAAPQTALGSIIGDPAYSMNVGAFRTTMDADIRHFPLSLHLGLMKRLTVTARLPIVATRSQVNFAADSGAPGDVGWNQLAPQAENAGAAAQILALLTELEAAAATVDAAIESGSFGCPASPECDDARVAVSDARQLRTDLALLAGTTATGEPLPVGSPFAPLASSNAGTALVAAIQDVSSRLAALGAPGVPASYPLPTASVGANDVNAMLADSAYGYGARPLEFTKYRQKLGDMEVGLRFGLLQGRSLRATLASTIRLPTGKLDDPDNYTDIAVGDKQTDVEFGVEAAWEPGSVFAVAASRMYNLQLSHTLDRRVMRHVEPMAPLSTKASVTRNLGDELRATIYPSIRLSRSFTVYGSAGYYRRGADAYTIVSQPEGSSPVNADDLAFQTALSSWRFGGGIHYYAIEGRRGAGLPIEAGIDFHSVFSGTGGQAPKSSGVYFYLRLHWGLFNKGAAPAPPPQPTEDPAETPPEEGQQDG